MREEGKILFELELSQHEQSGDRRGRCRPFSWMEGFDVLLVCKSLWRSVMRSGNLDFENLPPVFLW